MDTMNLGQMLAELQGARDAEIEQERVRREAEAREKTEQIRQRIVDELNILKKEIETKITDRSIPFAEMYDGFVLPIASIIELYLAHIVYAADYKDFYDWLTHNGLCYETWRAPNNQLMLVLRPLY